MDRTEALSRFIEQDIREFLDKKAGNSIELGFDKKVQKLLDENNYVAAFNLIAERIKDYNTSNNNATRAIIFSDIKKILPRISSQHGFNSKLEKLSFILRKELKDVEQLPNTITAVDKLLQEEAEEDRKKRFQAQKIKDELEPKIDALIKQIFVAIRMKDMKKAIGYYDSLKHEFALYPSIFKDRKTEIYNDIVSLYVQIKKIKRYAEAQDKKMISDKVKTAEERKSAVKKIGAKQIEQIISEIKEDSRKKDFDSAKEKLIYLRHIASRIPKEYKHIRLNLESKINVISQNIELAKRMSKDGVNLAKEGAVKKKGTAE